MSFFILIPHTFSLPVYVDLRRLLLSLFLYKRQLSYLTAQTRRKISQAYICMYRQAHSGLGKEWLPDVSSKGSV